VRVDTSVPGANWENKVNKTARHPRHVANSLLEAMKICLINRKYFHIPSFNIRNFFMVYSIIAHKKTNQLLETAINVNE